MGEERFRHQETIRQLQEANQAVANLRKRLKALTGMDHIEESESDAIDKEVSEMQRLRAALEVAVSQVEEERRSLNREREAHSLTHSMLREERLRSVKEKESLEERIFFLRWALCIEGFFTFIEISVSRKNLAEVVEEVIEAESLATEREKQLVTANQRIRDLEARPDERDIFHNTRNTLSYFDTKSNPFRKTFTPPPSYPSPPFSASVLQPASKVSFVPPPSPPVPHHFSPIEMNFQTQPSTQVPYIL